MLPSLGSYMLEPECTYLETAIRNDRGVCSIACHPQLHWFIERYDPLKNPRVHDRYFSMPTAHHFLEVASLRVDFKNKFSVIISHAIAMKPYPRSQFIARLYHEAKRFRRAAQRQFEFEELRACFEYIDAIQFIAPFFSPWSEN